MLTQHWIDVDKVLPMLIQDVHLFNIITFCLLGNSNNLKSIKACVNTGQSPGNIIVGVYGMAYEVRSRSSRLNTL